MKAVAVVCSFLLCGGALAASPGDVVINEVCWMGSLADFNDEWIELYNNTAQPVDLAGWTLDDDNGAAVYALSGTIPANGFFLLEKREEATDVPADLLDATLGLGNSGDSLELKDDLGTRIDYLDTAGGWYAGINNSGTQDISMERRNPDVAGDIATNWGDNDGVSVNGLDSGGNALIATPRAQNSIHGTFVAGPQIVYVQCLDETALEVFFSEDLDPVTAATAANYSVTGGFQPTAAALDGADPTLVHLSGFAGLTSETVVTLAAIGVENLGGDPSNTSADFVAGLASIAWVRTDANGDTVPDLLEQHPDAFVTVRGIVTEVDDFDYRGGRIQDATGGLAIWDQSSAVTSLLMRGDDIRLSGLVFQYNGLDQITDVRATVIGQDQAVAPTLLTLADLLADAESYESVLVGVVGVSDTDNGDTWPPEGEGASIEITDDGGTSVISMFIDRDTDIDGSPEPTYPVDLVGIASQFDETAPHDSGYSIQPRDLDDIGAGGGFCSPDGSLQSCYSGPDGTAGVGICLAGQQTCTAGTWGPCEGEVVPVATDDDCDGEDDNCDGTEDDGVDLQTDHEHCGACNSPCDPAESCIGGVCIQGACQDNDGDTYGTGCAAGPDCDDDDEQVNPGATERCDGVDNNCDGNTDEDWPELGESCDGADADFCALGQFTCAATQDATTCTGDTPQFEVCNGQDDDCDNDIDETFADLGDPCDGPDEDACADGSFVCNQSGTGLRCDGDGPAKVESCNNQDDDCDGLVDNLAEPEVTCGDGVCEVTVQICRNGQYQPCVPNKAVAGYESSESTCDDGLDNDCDGFTDLGDTNCRGGSGDDGGCGCGAGGPASLWLTGFLVAGLLRARRRRA